MTIGDNLGLASQVKTVVPLPSSLPAITSPYSRSHFTSQLLIFFAEVNVILQNVFSLLGLTRHVLGPDLGAWNHWLHIMTLAGKFLAFCRWLHQWYILQVIISIISACHLNMRGDRKINRLTQGSRSMVIDHYWTVSNVNCKPTTPSITLH